jgi:hypothetical protein
MASSPRNGFAVVASHAGIQYSSALMSNRKSSGILDRPVKPGDDDLCMDADQPSAGLPQDEVSGI